MTADRYTEYVSYCPLPHTPTPENYQTTEWYVDKYGDLRADATHHDGTNHYLYRVFKDGVSETQMENLRDKIYHGKATRADITRLTRRLGDEIAAVYGFDIPKQRTPQERGAR